MKVKVIKKFRDKETKVIHKAGDTLTISKKRFAEIQKVGNFVVEVTDQDEAADQDETADTEKTAE